METNYLVHHGVKGMKWGVRKQFQAAHRFRKSNKSNAIRVSKQYGDRIRGLEKRHEIEGEKIGDWGSAQGRKLMDRQYDEMKALKEEGRKAVNKAALLDAGYTEEQAEVGFKWMSDQEKKGSKYVMYKIKHSNEDDAFLVHHGVKGMRWGIRRYQNPDGSLTSVGRAKLGYKEAKKQFKQDAKKQRRAALTAVGATRLNRFQEARNKADSSRLKMIDAKAKYKKAKNGEGADIKVYSKQMRKTGLPGSAADDMYRGESARLYKHLTKTKGKAYADTVVKKTQNKVLRDLAISGTIAVGATATQIILTKKGYM